MKFGVPWSVKGIRPEARETAKEAARRAGMSLGDWLNSMILQQATQGGQDDEDDEYGDESEIAAVHQRLDDLTRKIDKFGKSGPAAYAPKRSRREEQEHDQNQIAELIARLDRRIDQVVQAARPVAPPLVPAMHPQAYAQHAPQTHAPQAYAPQAQYPQGYAAPVAAYPQQYAQQPVARPPAQPQIAPQARAPQQYPAPGSAIDRAVAEIAARQRALNGQPPMPAHQPAPMPEEPLAPVFAPVPTQDLSGLEDQLRKITTQIETLRRPGVEEAIQALRAELGEIGNALHEAMPRQAIDTIEHQIAGLSQRIAEGRQAGVDGQALAGIEHGLAEVRELLRGLTPAENLVGFNEAVSELAHKIDLIVAQQDPATLQQLEYAITTLREMAGHVASGEAVSGIAAQVHMLAERVEQIAAASGAGEALNNLEHRISALADALEERSRSGDAVPPMLESLVHSLSDKIERIQQSRGDNVAFDHLEDRIVKLVERLDASDSKLGHLEAIERGLADLLVQMDDLRAGRGGPHADNSPVVHELKHDIARTHDVLDSLRGTLGHVVDRLGAIEQGMRSPAHAPAEPDALDMRQPIGRVVARAVSEAAAAAPQQSPTTQRAIDNAQQQIEALAQAARAHTQAQAQPQQHAYAPPPAAPAPPQPAPKAKPMPRAAFNPEFPPDMPLEPGSGPPKLQAHASARFVASPGAPGNDGAPESKSGFISAARRAAQAAMAPAPAARPARAGGVSEHLPLEPIPTEEFVEEVSPRQSLRGKLGGQVKKLFLAACVVAIVVGSIQIAGNWLGVGGTQTAVPKVGDTPPAEPQADEPDQPTGSTETPALPPRSEAPSPIQQMPSLLSPPVLGAPQAPRPQSSQPAKADDEVTGSVTPSNRRPQAQPMTLPPMPAIQAPKTTTAAPGGLPTTIGGPQLRTAALAGDSGAAYEIATRYAEGRGAPANLEEAARWFERAAAKGLPIAQFRYASMLEKGQGVRKDLARARQLYVAAAGHGNAKAMHNLAVLYAEGIDGRPDYITAAQWFRKAAMHGVADSQFNLGVLAARGLGTEKSLTDAYRWFALAAIQGDREAGKKRDEVGGHLDASARAAADRDVKAFAPEPQPAAATAVPEPSGGWDKTTPTAAPASGKQHTTKPISLGAVQAGVR